MSVAKENFVKAIYLLESKDELKAKPGNVARMLGISNAATTDMARKLSERELVNYKKYQVLSLTEKGKCMALNVIRKHRLWETFLHKTFELSLSEIHREAELLEHQTSDFLAQKIESFLGEPKYDPYGDPIPGETGNIVNDTSELNLLKASTGINYEISRLASTDKEFFLFCKGNELNISNHLHIVKHYPSNQMTEVQTHNRKLVLNWDFAKSIFIKPLA